MTDSLCAGVGSSLRVKRIVCLIPGGSSMSFMKHNKTCFLIVFTLMAVLVQGAFAQTSTTGSIAGFVKDQSGAAVPGVTVTASGANSIRPQSATSGNDGSYTILNLPPGKYTIVATGGKGFAKY